MGFLKFVFDAVIGKPPPKRRYEEPVKTEVAPEPPISLAEESGKADLKAAMKKAAAKKEKAEATRKRKKAVVEEQPVSQKAIDNWPFPTKQYVSGQYKEVPTPTKKSISGKYEDAPF